ncbi:hypothetical protein BJ742DRAFT_824913 [Cladochytrium replicatum]|nr:hypothetical protein BJ742DRAFT_824913 [Cladochytrium replicatum]
MAVDGAVVAVCVVAGSTTIGAFVALVSGLVWFLRLSTPTSQIDGRKWTRFQKLTICASVAAIALSFSSAVEVVLTATVAPENLSYTSIALPGKWDKGFLRAFLSVIETLGQELISFTVFFYFLTLMERGSSFRLLLPVLLYQIIYQFAMVLGVIFFLLVVATSIWINVLPLSDSLLTFIFVSGNLLIIECIVIEWCLSIALCRAFFVKFMVRSDTSRPAVSMDNTTSWPFYRRSNTLVALSDVSPEKANPPLAETDRRNIAPVYPPSSPTTLYSLGDNRSDAHFAAEGTSMSFRFGQSANHDEPATVMSFVFKNRYHRRTALLFIGFAITDVVGGLIYCLSLLPAAEKFTRPLEIMGRMAIAFHMMLALIFFDSFKDVLNRSHLTPPLQTH